MTNTLKIAPLKRIYLKAGKFSLITDQNRKEINIATELKAKIIICKGIKIITYLNRKKYL